MSMGRGEKIGRGLRVSFGSLLQVLFLVVVCCLVCLVSFRPVGASVVHLEKYEFAPGDEVHFFVDTANTSRIDIIGNGQVFKLFGSPVGDQVFLPAQDGVYDVVLSSENGVVEDTCQFRVGMHLDRNSSILIEKEVFRVGEEVGIGLSVDGEYRLAISSSSDYWSYQESYGHDVMFIPPRAGNYLVVLTLLDSGVEETRQFRVLGEDEVVVDEDSFSGKAVSVLDRAGDPVDVEMTFYAVGEMINSVLFDYSAGGMVRLKTRSPMGLSDVVEGELYDFSIFGDSLTLDLMNVTFAGGLRVGLDELGREEIPLRHAVLGFSFDLTDVSYDEGFLKKVASGDSLYACPDFDSVSGRCLGRWDFVERIIPGEEYVARFSGEQMIGFAETEIEVLNIQSFPVVGGIWDVQFETRGFADLIVTPMDNTSWWSEGSGDLELWDISCDGVVLPWVRSGPSVVVADYSCDGVGSERSRVHTKGYHALLFEYGGASAVAYNDAKPWWNVSYAYRRIINFSNNNGSSLGEGYTLNVSLDTQSLIAQGKANEDCSDIRFTWFDGSKNVELDRINITPCNSTDTVFFLKSRSPIWSWDANYTVYYGFSGADSPPQNRSNIYWLWEDYEDQTHNFTNGALAPTITSGSKKNGNYGMQGNGNAGYRRAVKPETLARGLIIEGWVFSHGNGTTADLPGLEWGMASATEANGFQAVLDWRSATGSSADMQIRRNFNSGSVIASSTANTVEKFKWYYIKATWQPDGFMRMEVWNENMLPWGNLTANDSTYTTGYYGIGAYRNGWWDDVAVRLYTTSEPGADLSDEQANILVVTLDFPSNGQSQGVSDVNFTCSASSNDPLVNITLWGEWDGWHANETKSIGGLSNTTTFEKTLPDGYWQWNCIAYDETGLNGSYPVNYSVAIDATAPSVTIEAPSGELADPTPLLDVSFGEIVDSAWYVVDGGGDVVLCSSCSSYQVFLDLVEGDPVVEVFANDSFGNVGSGQTSLSIAFNRSFTDNFSDQSSILYLNGTVWKAGNVSFRGLRDGWWNASYAYRMQVDVTNPNADSLSEDYTINLTLNTTDLIARSRLEEDCVDLRIAANDGEESFELDRIVRDCANETTEVLFSLFSAVPGGETNTSYYVYIANPSAESPPEDSSQVYLLYEDFDDGTADGWIAYNGIWSVSADAYYQSDNQGAYMRTAYQNASWKDYAVDVMVNVLSGGATGGFAGVLFRWQNETDHYATILDDRDDPDDSIWLRQWIADSYTTETQEWADVAVDRDVWLPMRIEVCDDEGYDRTRTIFDGIIHEYNYSAFDSGGVGLMMHGTQAYYDNVTVREFLGMEPVISIGGEQFKAAGDQGHLLGRPVNTTQEIAFFKNVSWVENGTDSANNISVRVSADGGLKYCTVENGGGIRASSCQDFQPGNSLVYDVVFVTDDTRTISISSLSFSWSEDGVPPDVSLSSPVQGSFINASFLINASVDDDGQGVESVLAALTDGTGDEADAVALTLSSGDSSAGYWTLTYEPSGLEDGRYNLTVNASDVEGNFNDSERSEIIIDTTPPLVGVKGINITGPADRGESVCINVSGVSDENGILFVAADVLLSNGTFASLPLADDADCAGEEGDGVFGGIAVVGDSVGQFAFVNVTVVDSAGQVGFNATNVSIEVIETVSPLVSLVSPLNNSGDADGDIIFRFNVSDDSQIENCSLFVDGTRNQTNTSVNRSEMQSFAISVYGSASVAWDVECFDGFGNIGTLGGAVVDVIILGDFNGTNLSEVDVENIEDLTIFMPEYGRITFLESINLSGGANLSEVIMIGDNLVSVDSAADPRLNKSARLNLLDLSYLKTPVVYRDDVLCSGSICQVVSYVEGNFTFDVTGFSAYSSGSNALLGIWDATDDEGGEFDVYLLEQAFFYANYTNASAGIPITGSGVACNITFDAGEWTEPVNMSFNGSSGLYYYNRTFDASGIIPYNVTCDGASQGYEPLALEDEIFLRGLDFKVQRGYVTIEQGDTQVTLIAGDNYSAPEAQNRSFIRVVSTRLSAVGHNSGGGTQDPDEFMVSIVNPENLLNSITFERYSSTASYNTRIYWEIIEYTGEDGGDNEMVVRSQDEIAQTTGASMNGSAVSGVEDDSDIVVFITSQRHNGAGTSSTADRGLYTSEWFHAEDTPGFTRGDGTGTSSLSYAVVEFKGPNWKVQTANHSYTAAGSWQTESITAVNDVSRAFIHAQMRTASGNIDEQGQQVYLSATDQLSFRLRSAAGLFSQYARVWVVENTQTAGRKMDVQRVSGSRASSTTEPEEWTESVTPVDALETSSIWGETGDTAGTSSPVPRGSIGFLLNETDTVYLWRSDSGQPNDYRFEVVEWPTETVNFEPAAPDMIYCDGTTDCGIVVDQGVILQADGASDLEGDTFIYVLQAALENATYGSDLESGEMRKIANDSEYATLIDDDFSTDTGIWSYAGTCSRVTGNTNCRDGDACILCVGSGAVEDGRSVFADDLSSYQACEIGYYYRANSLDDSSECGYHRYFDTSWHDVLSVCDPADDNLWHGQTHNYTQLGYTLEDGSQIKYAIEANGGADYWYIDNVNLSCYTSQSLENATIWTRYDAVVPNDYQNIDNITVTVDVSAYVSAGSTIRANNPPDLQVALYNGTAFRTLGNFSLSGMGNTTLTITDAKILDDWQDASVRSVRFRGIYMDYVDAINRDQINWTGIWVDIHGDRWTYAGNHSPDMTLYWNTSLVPENDLVYLRAAAIDVNGSGEYSEWYVAQDTLNITHPTNVTGIALNATFINQSQGILLSANITDTDGIASANVTLLYPNGTGMNYSLFYVSADLFRLYLNDTNQSGNYSFTKVHVVDGWGNYRNFSYTSLNFTVNTSPPAVFDLIAPLNGTETALLLPNLSWEMTDDAAFANYTVLLDKDMDVGSPDFTYAISGMDTTYKLVEFALDANSVYYWQVVAYDVFGSRTNSTSKNAYITDTVKPQVTLNLPISRWIEDSVDVMFNYSVNDTNTVANCSLLTNTSGLYRIESVNTTVVKSAFNFFTIPMYDGLFIWDVECNDTAGNAARSAQNRTVIVDLSPPTVVVGPPANVSLENETNNVRFTVNASDKWSNVSSCELLVDNVSELTEPAIVDGVAFNFTKFLFNGNYTWSVNCTDQQGNWNMTGTHLLEVRVIDENPPLVTPNRPSSGQNLPSTVVLFNYTAEDATGLENCSLWLDGDLDETNLTPTNLGFNYFTKDLSEGVHNWSVSCYDNSTEFNQGNSSWQNFSIDLSNPVVSLTAPEDDSKMNSLGLVFNYTPQDAYLDACILSTNASGSFIPVQVNDSPVSGVWNAFSYTVPEGRFVWNVRCNDTSGRSAFALDNYSLTVDTTPPVFSGNVSYPESPVAYASGQSYTFNISWSDNIDVSAVVFESNFSGSVGNTSVDLSGAVYSLTVSDLFAAGFSYRWYANDTAGNKNATPLYTYTINKAQSSIQFFLDGIESNVSIDEDELLNASISLVVPSQGIVQLYRNGSLLQEGESPLTNLTVYPDPGSWNYTAVYPATQNYTKSDKTWFLTVNDTTSPNVSLMFPPVNGSVGSLTFQLLYNVTDATPIQNCSLYLNGSLVQTNTSVVRNATQSFVHTFEEGIYDWYVRCYDWFGNSGVSETRNVTVVESTRLVLDVEPVLEEYELGSLANISVRSSDIFDAPLSANVTVDVIYGNTSLSWWDAAWQRRKAILLSSPRTLPHVEMVVVNVSGLAGNISSCLGEMRIVRNTSQNHSLVPVVIVSGDDADWCLVRFNAEFDGSGNLQDEYYAYYNNSQALNPGYSVTETSAKVQWDSIVAAGTQLTDTIAQVNLSRAFLLFTYLTSDSGPDGGMFTGNLTSTGVQFDRYQATGTANIAYQVVEHPDISVQRGEVTFGSGEWQKVVDVSWVNMSESFIIVSSRTSDADIGDHHDGWTLARFLNSTAIALERNATTSEAKAVYQVVRWQGAQVQNGTSTIGAGSSTIDVSLNAVNLSRAFVIVNRNTDEAALGIDDQHVQATFGNATGLTLRRESTDGLMNVGWFVVDIPETIKAVQVNQTTVTGTSTVAVSQLNWSKSFLYLTWRNTGNGQTFTNSYLLANMTSSTLFTISKQSGSSQIGYATTYLVELDDLPQVSMSLGDAEYFRQRFVNESGIDGEADFLFNTSTSPLGNYSLVAVGTSSGFSMGVDRSFVEIVPDHSPPNVTLLEPSDGYQQGVGSANFTYVPSDINLANCTLFVDVNGTFSANQTHISPLNNQNNTFDPLYFGVGIYTWNVNCTDLLDNWGFALENFTLNITGPDFTVFEGGLFFDTLEYVEGKNVTVFANVTNAGLSTYTGTGTLQFYLGYPGAGGSQIEGNKTFSDLGVGESVVLNASYLMVAGKNEIWVMLDAQNVANESDEMNNNASLNVSVSLYQLYYGNVTKNIVLGFSDDDSLLGFANSTVNNNSFLFVSDIDSSFSFLDLQAIGRTLNNLSVGNDLTDVDVALDSVDFDDSIKQVWGNGSDTPISTRAFNLSTGDVSSVPVVNSTQDSPFVTGILWDTADDLSVNQQYDSSDEEDLVFVTEIDSGMIGGYGTYDYEIKVPALLREYKGATDAFMLYVELR